jgi:hypothetical protein
MQQAHALRHTAACTAALQSQRRACTRQRRKGIEIQVTTAEAAEFKMIGLKRPKTLVKLQPVYICTNVNVRTNLQNSYCK